MDINAIISSIAPAVNLEQFEDIGILEEGSNGKISAEDVPEEFVLSASNEPKKRCRFFGCITLMHEGHFGEYCYAHERTKY